MKIDRTLIGDRLIQYRQHLNMSQPFVSDYTGILQSTLSNVENGKGGGLDVFCTLLAFYQKHFNLVNFFSEEFVPVPKDDELINVLLKKTKEEKETRKKVMDKKLNELLRKLNEAIELNQK